ncbi:MAG: fimbrillin family protein [Rikenellaceae bacterium]
MKRLLLCFGMVATMFSCAQSEEAAVSYSDGDIITFSAAKITRVTDNGATLSWEGDDQVQIISSDVEEEATYNIANTSSGALSYVSGSIFYTDQGAEKKFYGWSPASISHDSGKLALDVSDQSSLKQIVVGSATTSVSSATMTFKPLLTKVVLYLSVGTFDLTDLSDLSGATARLSGANTSGQYDYASGEFTDLSSSVVSKSVTVASDGSNATVIFYVLETESMNGSIAFTVGDEQFVTSIAGKKWLRGEEYEYDVTVGTNYLAISTAEDLFEFAAAVNSGTSYDGATVKLKNDIDLYDSPWTPIGTGDNPFKGHFDGDGYTISGLYINASSEYQGLFGVLYDFGSIKNLTVSGSFTLSGSGFGQIGGITGYAGSGSIIENCANKVYIDAPLRARVGGIVGYSGATIINCCNFAKVFGNWQVGGIVGDNLGTVANCYNRGYIYGSNEYVGGIIGYNENTTEGIYIVKNSYNTATIDGASDLGGIVGYPWSECSNCFNTIVLASIGGTGYSGVTGTMMSNADMQTQDFVDTLNADTDVWKMDYTDGQINEGYPILTWQ